MQTALLCERGEWVPAANAVIRCVAHLKQAGCLAHGIQALGFAAVMLEQTGDDTGAATLCGNPPLTNITAFGEHWVARQRVLCEQSLRQRLGEAGFEECAGVGARMDMDAFADFAVDRLQRFIATAS